MLKFAVEYQSAIDKIAGERESNLRKYEMGALEWTLAKELCEVLKVRGVRCYSGVYFPLWHARLLTEALFALQIFKEVTLFFSRATPNLATVIPAMDYLDRELATNMLNDDKYQPAIRAALGMAKRTVNRYYNKTDYSEVYRIAMSVYHSNSLFIIFYLLD